MDDVQNKQLWLITPVAGKPDTYTIKNEATGLFITLEAAGEFFHSSMLAYVNEMYWTEQDKNPRVDASYGLRITGLPKSEKLNQEWIIRESHNPHDKLEVIL